MKKTSIIDVKSLIIGALGCALVFVVMGTSPAPEPQYFRGIYEYKIEEHNSATLLEGKVKAAIGRGYLPLGGVSSTKDGRFNQALVKIQ